MDVVVEIAERLRDDARLAHDRTAGHSKRIVRRDEPPRADELQKLLVIVNVVRLVCVHEREVEGALPALRQQLIERLQRGLDAQIDARLDACFAPEWAP